ncbi:hypothetical protein Lal_00019409 [Lupinus albus]|nr:hypothetical protein Lal_00019409 [Lupinus albus]
MIRNECIREKIGVAPIVEKMMELHLRLFGHVGKKVVEAPNELDYCGEEPSTSPRAPLQQQQSQAVMHVPSSGFVVTLGSSGQPTAGQGLRSEHCDNQTKNSVFSNALSSPVRRSLHQAGNHSSVLGNRNTESGYLHQQSKDAVTFSSIDSAMDMHAD